MGLRHACDIRSQAPPFLSCALKRSGSLGTRLLLWHDVHLQPTEYYFPVLPPRREPQSEDQHPDHVLSSPSPWQHAQGGLEEPVGLPFDSFLCQATPRVHVRGKIHCRDKYTYIEKYHYCVHLWSNRAIQCT